MNWAASMHRVFRESIIASLHNVAEEVACGACGSQIAAPEWKRHCYDGL